MSNRDNKIISLDPVLDESKPLVGDETADLTQLNLFGLCKVPRSIYNIVVLGLIFMLLFTAFGPAQNLQTTLNKANNSGGNALGALYFTFSASNFVAPTIAVLLGERLTMTLGAIGYALFVASNMLDHKAKYFLPLFVTAAVANGFGAAILWTAQGSFLTKNSTPGTMGRNNGIFFALFQISQVAGNLIAAFLLPEKGRPVEEEAKAIKTLFIAFTTIACIAVVSFAALRKPPHKSVEEVTKKASVLDRFIGIFRMFGKRAFLLMVAIIIYSGLSQAYFAGTYTKLIGNSDSKRVGYVMACFGASNVLGSVGIGKVLDLTGRKVVMFFSAFFILAATGIICLVSQEYFQSHIYICIICAILMGISDAGMNTMLTATTGVIFEDDPENAFGAFKFVQATTSAINYVLGLSIYPSTLMLDIFLLLGCLLFFLMDELELRDKKLAASRNIQES